jgi:hypothetical protein
MNGFADENSYGVLILRLRGVLGPHFQGRAIDPSGCIRSSRHLPTKSPFAGVWFHVVIISSVVSIVVRRISIVKNLKEVQRLSGE